MIGCLESVGGCAFPSDKAAGRSLFLAARPTRRSTEHRSESGHRIVVVTGWARSHERLPVPRGDKMTLYEVLPTIQSLRRAEKLRLIQLLAEDVARDDGIVFDVADKTVSIWSPHDSLQGAATLLRVLDEDRATS